jgi:selenide,water dikinase
LRPLGSIFNAQDYPDLLVGIDSPDDAAVWRIDETRSIVVTTDFFTPVVDEPYDYGAISAANSLSDIYAMGADPILALNIAAFPPQLPAEFLSQIILGAAEKAKEAGVVIAGGHTIQDKEPKFGLVVIGIIETQKILTKSGVQPDDILILTKPLGMGVTTTANKAEKAKKEDIEEAKFWMRQLNKIPSKIATQLDLKAATDITGFSLLGHAHEMAETSKVGMVINSVDIPFISGARYYGEKWYFAGGAADNRLYYEKFIEFSEGIDEVTRMLLFDPQTSGGLLLACSPEKISEFEDSANSQNMPYWKIGQAIHGTGIVVK